MNPLKIAAIILIIGAGLAGSYFIIKNSALSFSVGQAGEDNNSSSQGLLSENPIKWLENKADSFTESIKNIANSGKSVAESIENAEVNDKNSINLTELVAQTMFGKIKDLDQAGKNPFQEEGFDLKNEESQKLIQDAVASIQGGGDLFDSEIKYEDLKISNDNSKEAKMNYLFSIQEAFKKYFNDPSLQPDQDQLMNNVNQDCFGGGGSANFKIAEAYNNTANECLNISVPSDWLEVHKEIILSLKKGNLIFKAIAGCIADPMKGYLAVQALPQLAAEITAVGNALKKKAAEDGLF